jgi:hypothetical protein
MRRPDRGDPVGGRAYLPGGRLRRAKQPQVQGSSAIFHEYYEQPDSYQGATRADSHTVGEIAYRDEEGYYHICGRKNDMIVSSGMNIYPGRDQGRPGTASGHLRRRGLRDLPEQ